MSNSNGTPTAFQPASNSLPTPCPHTPHTPRVLEHPVGRPGPTLGILVLHMRRDRGAVALGALTGWTAMMSGVAAF